MPADIRKEDRLEGRDQVEGPFYDSRKKYDSVRGTRKERTDACGTVGIDSLGTREWWSGEWGEEEQREVQLFKVTQAVRSHECEDNGVIYQEYLA